MGLTPKGDMTRRVPVSLGITVLNEQETVRELFVSIAKQHIAPSEVVIVDGYSTDNTWQLLHELATEYSKLPVRLFQHKGTVGAGRNAVFSHARFAWVATTDAGCVLEPSWLESLWDAQRSSKALIVAGYAIGAPKSNFEAAVVPYVLVMPDSVTDKFLPATRSSLIHRSVWKQLGGFAEHVQVSEDFAFSRAARHAKIPMTFAPKAIVHWQPRSSVRAFWRMIYCQARDDIRLKNWRLKVLLVWLRYMLAVVLVIGVGMVGGLKTAIVLSIGGLFLYASWAIYKQLKWVPKSWFWFPTLQFAADTAIMLGSLVGIAWYLKNLKKV